MDDLIKKWLYHLPSDETQLKQFAQEVIEEVKKLQKGEVINGVLKGMIDPRELDDL